MNDKKNICPICKNSTNKHAVTVDGSKIGTCSSNCCAAHFRISKGFFLPMKYDESWVHERMKERAKLSRIAKTRLAYLLKTVRMKAHEIKLLEIGPGTGEFLAECYRRNIEAYYVEKSKANYAYLQKNIISTGWMDLKEANEKKPFNIIVMFDVLEHLENPHAILNHLLSLTNKEKLYFYIIIPNLNSWHRFCEGAEYGIYLQPDHQIFYTKKTINYLMSSFSLNMVALKTISTDGRELLVAIRKLYRLIKPAPVDLSKKIITDDILLPEKSKHLYLYSLLCKLSKTISPLFYVLNRLNIGSHIWAIYSTTH